MGVPTDVAKSSRQALARAWSLAFHEHRSVPDGIIYPSRLNGHTNLAIFDRHLKIVGGTRGAVDWSTRPCHRHKRSSREPRRHHLRSPWPKVLIPCGSCGDHLRGERKACS
ncbi:RES domain-containing protein [Sinorhizobium meliloti]|uniref:RES domain-containing protein n=1 Tax=Rhizobium meliloti TaxID=382 RepID=UPI0022797217|nr:RES domain-containing protein [Sinorhizobium meliloti]